MVDVNISDLFFNFAHETGNDGEFNNLVPEAQDLLDRLSALGVAIPLAGELVEDFYDRL
jgi:hypothetical protein